MFICPCDCLFVHDIGIASLCVGCVRDIAFVFYIVVALTMFRVVAFALVLALVPVCVFVFSLMFVLSVCLHLSYVV